MEQQSVQQRNRLWIPAHDRICLVPEAFFEYGFSLDNTVPSDGM